MTTSHRSLPWPAGESAWSITSTSPLTSSSCAALPDSGSYPHPAGLSAQHRVLVPGQQQLSILRPVTTAQQGDQAEYPAHQHVSDLEQNGQPSTTASSLSAIAQVSNLIEYSSGTGKPCHWTCALTWTEQHRQTGKHEPQAA